MTTILHASSARRTRHGFTLVELLLVITIIGVLAALTFPAVNAMRRETDRAIGINSVTFGVAAARSYATEKINSPDLPEFGPDPDPSGPAEYSGAAALFTPAGEIRLVRNGTSAFGIRARFGNEQHFIERLDWNPTTGDLEVETTSTLPPTQGLSGFSDIAIDYIVLPPDAAVAGLVRNVTSDAGDPPLLVSPPFAVWFDASGQLVAGNTGSDSDRPRANRFVYYDGNGNGAIDLSGSAVTMRARASRFDTSFTLDEFDPRTGDFDAANNYDRALKRYRLPIEQIETVVGVAVYSRRQFEQEAEDGGFAWDNQGLSNNNNDAWEWMEDNAAILLFSRQSGTIFRKQAER